MSLTDISEDEEPALGAINFWANQSDKECDWLSPSLKGGDVVCLLGVNVEIKEFAAGPFAKVTYKGDDFSSAITLILNLGVDKRRPMLIWPAENILAEEPLGLKVPHAKISGNHKNCVTWKKIMLKNKDFPNELEKKVEKIVQNNKSKISENRKKYVVGIIEEIYFIKVSIQLKKLKLAKFMLVF